MMRTLRLAEKPLRASLRRPNCLCRFRFLFLNAERMLTLIVSTRSAPLCHGANLASEPFRRLGSDLGENASPPRGAISSVPIRAAKSDREDLDGWSLRSRSRAKESA